MLGEIAQATGARTAVDLFTGTTRVAQEFKSRGIEVTATDLASYHLAPLAVPVEGEPQAARPRD